MSFSDQAIEETVNFVKSQTTGEGTGHDWFHIQRVWQMACYIHSQQGEGDLFIVQMTALLHDLADEKLGDEEAGLEKIAYFLEGLSQSKMEQILANVQSISYHKQLVQESLSVESQIVQDADRLDAMGAIGIARAFTYGGSLGQAIWDPASDPRLQDDPSDLTPTTINHFYQKLLLLKDQMNTEIGQALAQDRHQFMLTYLDQFYQELDRAEDLEAPEAPD